MFYLWQRCVGSARLQLGLFDLLSLEDVQYLSAQFPIILPMDRSNSFTVPLQSRAAITAFLQRAFVKEIIQLAPFLLRKMVL